MSRPSWVPETDWETLKRKAIEHGGQDPRLLAAIGKHETQWGDAGVGRPYIMGYAVFPGGKVTPKYKGFERQVGGAAFELQKHGFNGPVATYADLLAFAQNEWQPVDPESWAQSVWSIYQGIDKRSIEDTAIATMPAVDIFRTDQGAKVDFDGPQTLLPLALLIGGLLLLLAGTDVRREET